MDLNLRRPRTAGEIVAALDHVVRLTPYTAEVAARIGVLEGEVALLSGQVGELQRQNGLLLGEIARSRQEAAWVRSQAVVAVRTLEAERAAARPPVWLQALGVLNRMAAVSGGGSRVDPCAMAIETFREMAGKAKDGAKKDLETYVAMLRGDAGEGWG